MTPSDPTTVSLPADLLAAEEQMLKRAWPPSAPAGSLVGVAVSKTAFVTVGSAGARPDRQGTTGGVGVDAGQRLHAAMPPISKRAFKISIN